MPAFGDEERIGVDVLPALERNRVGSELRQVAADRDAVALAQPLPGDGARGDAHRGLARRLPAAAAVVADAVLLPVRVVGVAGAERVGDVRVVLAALVLVADQQRDRRARRAALEHAGQDLDGVGLAPLRHVPRRAGPAAVEFVLDVGLRERQSGRAAVDDAADRGTVRFAERREAEQRAERVAGHGRARRRVCRTSLARGSRASGARGARAKMPAWVSRRPRSRTASSPRCAPRGVVAVLTGAGVSAESGVPTFRDAQQGLWAQFDPRELATPAAFARNPKRVWDWYAMRRDMVARVAPNPAHFALAPSWSGACPRSCSRRRTSTGCTSALAASASSSCTATSRACAARTRAPVVAQWQRTRRRAAAALSRMRRVPAAGRRLVRGDAAGGRARRRRGRRAPVRRAARRRHVGGGLSGGRAARAGAARGRARRRGQSERDGALRGRRPRAARSGRRRAAGARGRRVPGMTFVTSRRQRRAVAAPASRNPVRIDSPSFATRNSP